MNQSILLARVLVIWSLSLTPSLAQVTADQTLKNESSIVDLQNNRILINGGATRGQSLFHSLKDLSIGEGQEVFFTNPNNINTILTRVTGGKLSNINGTLGVLGDADLFLINPAGIAFGPNASLMLNGSFIATTGDSLTFEEGKEFNARSPKPVPELKVSVPIGIQFNGNSGGINLNNTNINLTQSPQNSSFLENGKTFALVGNEINVNSTNLSISPGSIEFLSLSQGFVSINQNRNSFSLQSQSGNNTSNINIKDSFISISPNDDSFGGFSGINFQGKDIFLDSSNLNTLNDLGVSGDIEIRANILTLENSIIEAIGNIVISTQGLFLDDDSRIGSTTIFVPIDPFRIKKVPELVKKTKTISKGCRPGQSLGNGTFVNVGRGGVPLGPHRLQTPHTIWNDLRQPKNLNLKSSFPQSHKISKSSKTKKNSQSSSSTSHLNLVEAKGWIRDEQGQIVLTASTSQRSAYNPNPQNVTC